MKKDLIFLTNNKDEVALTSTSANTIANLAKESYQTIEKSLQGMCFYSTSIKLLDSHEETKISEGFTEEQIKVIPALIERISKLKSLIAWLREGIKAKENLKTVIMNTAIEQYAALEGIELPKQPVEEPHLTEDDYWANMDIKARNRYYQLETECATIGKYIHGDVNSGFEADKGIYAIARAKLKEKLAKPFSKEGTGRDTTIYVHNPTADVDTVDEVFFELQKKHREAQAQLNSMKHECDMAVSTDANTKAAEYIAALKEYNNQMNIIKAQFVDWRTTQLRNLYLMKIVIPKSLMDIYNEVNSLGK